MRGERALGLGVIALAVALLIAAAPAFARPMSRCEKVGASGPVGTPHRDVICGRGGNDTIMGLRGNDLLIGGPGRDVLIGGPGRDVLRGGRGNDLLIGGPGRDVLIGGPGRDVLRGGPGGDHLTAGSGRDVLIGGPGRDVLRGGRGRDFLAGGADRDFCYGSIFMKGCERRPYQIALPQLQLPPPCCPTAERPDTDPPDPLWFGFSRRYIDTSAGDTDIVVWVDARDPSGIGSAALQIDGPNGTWRIVDLESVTSERLEASIAVPASTPAGDYRITSLTVADKEGNGRTLIGAELTEAGRSEFAVFHGPDLEGPVLTSFSLSPTEVDTSNAPAGIEASVGATDGLSGVKSIRITVQYPDREPSPPVLLGWCGGETAPDEGTRHAGTWRSTHSLVEHAMPGTYRIGGVYLCDLAGNTSRYTREELEALGYPTEFVQTGPGDTTPPEIVGFRLEPATLHVAEGEATIYFYVHVRDDDTGIGEWPDKANSRIHVSIQAPPHPGGITYGGRTPELISGTTLDGVWRRETTLEEDAPPGEYEIVGLAATDRAGNRVLLKDAELEAKGWDLSFENLP